MTDSEQTDQFIHRLFWRLMTIVIAAMLLAWALLDRLF